jgi:hypothetical protein
MGQGLPATNDVEENQKYFKSPQQAAGPMLNGLFALQY